MQYMMQLVFGRDWLNHSMTHQQTVPFVLAWLKARHNENVIHTKNGQLSAERNEFQQLWTKYAMSAVFYRRFIECAWYD